MTELRYEYRPGTDLALRMDNLVLWRYHFSTLYRKPFIHPICATNGAELTCFEPWDKWWQRGMWFSLQYVNGVNFWEEDIEEMGPKGMLTSEAPEVVELNKDYAQIQTSYRYMPPDEEPMLSDSRTLRFTAPENDYYTIDWSISLTAMRRVVIDTSRYDRDGTAGLAWRFSRAMGDLRVLSSEGLTGPQAYTESGSWIDITGKVDGRRGGAAGITIMVHPDSARYPARWILSERAGEGFVNPSLAADEPLEMSVGETLECRYRALVHAGWDDPDMFEAEYHRFIV